MTFLKMINSSGVKTMNTSFISGPTIFSCLDAGYLNILAFVSVLVNTSNMSTYSRSFPSFLQPSLSNGKGANSINRLACTRAAGIESTYTRDTCAKSTSAGDTFFARGVSIQVVFFGDVCMKSTCIGSTSAVKYSKI